MFYQAKTVDILDMQNVGEEGRPNNTDERADKCAVEKAEAITGVAEEKDSEVTTETVSGRADGVEIALSPHHRCGREDGPVVEVTGFWH